MKDKFKEAIEDNIEAYSSYSEGYVKEDSISKAASECATLCDQFSVEFYEWMISKSWEHEYREGRTMTTAELLQLYKNRNDEIHKQD